MKRLDTPVSPAKARNRPTDQFKGEWLLKGDMQKLAADPRKSVPKTLRHVQTRVRPGASATEEAQAVNIVMFLLLAEGSTVFMATPPHPANAACGRVGALTWR